MQNESLFEKIDAYLNNRLPATEVKAFEEEVKGNAELATQVELQRFEQDAMELLLEEDLRTEVASWRSEMKTTTPEQTKSEPSGAKATANPMRWVFPLALIGVIALALYFFIPTPEPKEDVPVADDRQEIPVDQNQQTEDTENTTTPSEPKKYDGPIANNNNQDKQIEEETNPDNQTTIESLPKIDNAPVVATQSNALEIAQNAFKDDYLNSTSEKLAAIATAYQNKNYKEVIDEVRANFSTGDIDYLNAQEYLNAAYFQLKDFKNAETAAKNILRSGQASYRERAEFNLLLAQVASEQTMSVDFTRLMDKIINNPQHFGHEEVKKIKEEGKF